MINKKSDVAAKNAYVRKLNAIGYDAHVTGAPADITATKDGETWYFEIKMTRHEDRYFGAATLTEWRQAFRDPMHFRFVVAISDDTDSVFKFIEYTPDEFMSFSTIPPFKIFFNIDFAGKPKKVSRIGKKATPLSLDNFRLLDACYEKLDKHGDMNL